MADERDQQRRAPDNPFDAWLAEAPAAPPHALCPWCSARLDSPDVDTCPACGAHLHAAEVDAIPGVTVVDPEAGRRMQVVRPSGGMGLFTWLTGDRDLVDAALAPQPGPAAAPLLGAGVESRDAVAPPDAQLRREMRRVGRDADEEEETAGSPESQDGPGTAADQAALAGADGTDAADAPDAPSPPRGGDGPEAPDAPRGGAAS